MKKASGHVYPPREAFATRPSPELAAEGGNVGDITALDRPRFVEDVDLGVPHTHTHEGPRDSAPPESVRSEPALFEEPPEELRGAVASATPSPPRFPWLTLLIVGVLTSLGGAAFGYWLAAGP